MDNQFVMGFDSDSYLYSDCLIRYLCPELYYEENLEFLKANIYCDINLQCCSIDDSFV